MGAHPQGTFAAVPARRPSSGFAGRRPMGAYPHGGPAAGSFVTGSRHDFGSMNVVGTRAHEVNATNSTTSIAAQASSPGPGTVSARATAIPPACAHPGDWRTVELQPVFFKSSAADPAPTGASWARRLRASRTIWGKLGVSFTTLSAIEKIDAPNKTAGATPAEIHRIRATQSGPGIEVFMVDNDLAVVGGGATAFSGTANAQVIVSDRGTSNTLLAHELGHVLISAAHPPAGGDPGTIMDGSGSHSSANPTRNTMVNYAKLAWPPPSGSTCLSPDP
jgi:hypothetical protein